MVDRRSSSGTLIAAEKPQITVESIMHTFERSGSEGAGKRFQEAGGIAPYGRAFGTDLQTGLSLSERDTNYAERKAKWGINVLPDPPQTTWCQFFIGSFEDLMLRILIVCALLSLGLTLGFPEECGIFDEDGKPDVNPCRKNVLNYVDTISIFVAVVVVSIVQTQTNYSQQKAFLEINQLKNEFNVNVIRQGEEMQILSTEVLVGDILSLKEGNRVAADGFFISGHALKVNNSQETGESCAVAVSEVYPFVLSGGAVESGDGHVLVAAVGPYSQSGSHMADIQELDEEKEKSPLEKKLDKVAKVLTFIGIGGGVLTALVLAGFWIAEGVKNGFTKEMASDLVARLMIGIAIFIAAVPEGLPLAVTLSLGFSMKKMMNDNNFVRHLQACETMGGATTICSDKTGTLTQNRMTVVKFFMDGTEQGQEVNLNPAVLKIFSEAIAINSNAYSHYNEEKKKLEYVGSSSECALLQMLPRWEVNYNEIRQQNQSVVLHEFSSARKKMSTVVAHEGRFRAFIKGAPDFVLRGASHYLNAEGEVLELTQEVRDAYLGKVSAFSDEALRTLLVCYRDLDVSERQPEWDDPANVETDVTVIALVGIEDPLRPEVIGAIQSCDIAGVMVRMVTGDFINTAKAIASRCGILKPDGIAMLGEEFAGKSKTDLIDILPKLQVLARSSPRDKLRLVTLLMEAGEVVAVTGDGSNDSPALKKANVGLSMGVCGTELAKMASDIVILDDNFQSIVSALKWGRCVYDNVRGFLQFQLTVNFAAMGIAFIGSCGLEESPLKTIQLLWVNLIMDSLGALALATRGPSEALLRRPPYGESDGLISNVLLRNIIGHVGYQMVVMLLCMFGGIKIFGLKEEDIAFPTGDISDIKLDLHLDDEKLEARLVSSFVFNTFVFMQVFNLINARVAGQDMSVLDGILQNPYFIAIFFLIAILQFILSHFAAVAFHTFGLEGKYWGISIAFGVGELIVGFFLRMIRLTDHTTEKLQALRALRAEQIKRFYEGVPGPQQWEMTSLDAPEEQKKEE
jgi:Ca2+-transporting ATPase